MSYELTADDNSAQLWYAHTERLMTLREAVIAFYNRQRIAA